MRPVVVIAPDVLSVYSTGKQHLVLRLTAEFPVLLWCQRKRADVARLLENFLETGLAVDLFMVARQRQQHCRGIFCRRTCQLDRYLAA